MLRRELPSRAVCSTDIDRHVLGGTAAWLEGEQGGEAQRAWCGNRLCVARLRRTEATVGGAAATQRGTHVVTGGLGGLGLRGAVRLAEVGVSAVVLTSRSGAVARHRQVLNSSLRALLGVSTPFPIAA